MNTRNHNITSELIILVLTRILHDSEQHEAHNCCYLQFRFTNKAQKIKNTYISTRQCEWLLTSGTRGILVKQINR